MRVKNLKIKAYRGIRDIELDFDVNEPTVLIGINGSGKTSILNCLSVLLRVFTERIQSPNNRIEAFDEQDITRLADISELYSEITLSYAIKDARLDAHALEDMTTFSCGLSLQDFGLQPNNSLEDLTLISLRVSHQLRTNPKFNIPIIVFYPVNRALSIDLSHEYLKRRSAKYPQLEAYEDALLIKQTNFSMFSNWFKNREDIENEKRISESLDTRDLQLEAVRNAISKFLPNCNGLRIKRSPLPPRMVINKMQQEFNIEQLSDGEQCLLALIGDLARRMAIANPGLGNPLDGTGIILIDEVELHLHPQWQRMIIPRLTKVFPNCQFIVTTHSPQVISDLKPESLHVLESTSTGISAKHPSVSLGRDSNYILEELMGTSERPIIFQKKLRRLFRLIEDDCLNEAKDLKKDLQAQMGDDESELEKASILIRRKEVLGK